MSHIFKIGQEVGIRKNPVLGPQTGTIMEITDDNKYHVLCRAIFPHKWVVYICQPEEIFMPPPNPYKSTYSLTYLENLFSNGTIYRVDTTSYYIRENVQK